MKIPSLMERCDQRRCQPSGYGEAVSSISGLRRENTLRLTDPEYEDLLEDRILLSSNSLEDFFSEEFLRKLVQKATAQVVPVVQHPSGSSALA